jgi:hypothetical protein
MYFFVIRQKEHGGLWDLNRDPFGWFSMIKNTAPFRFSGFDTFIISCQ